jgi:hypothetical protein
MNDSNEIWTLYEQSAAQPPQYQPTSNDKKAMQMNAAAQKPQVAPQVNVQVMPQPQTTVRAQPQMTAAPAPSVVSQDEQLVQDEQEEHEEYDEHEEHRNNINIAHPKRTLQDNFNSVVDSLQHQLLK